jgi:4-amino-4-deoxy-L-arabinose transferase-like glycosyltransferase
VEVPTTAAAERVASNDAESSVEARFVQAAAGLSIAAGLIHASVIASHFQEYWLFGVFFVFAALFQWAWGVAALSSREDRRLLVIGAAVNLAIVLLWLLTRTVGLPIGPEPGEIESAGVHDLFATADEVAVVIVAGLVLTSGGRAAARVGWLIPPLWVLAVVSGISAFLGDHSA